MAGLQPQFAQIPEAIIFPFNIPTISGFGASAGFNFLLQDRSGTLSVEQLGARARKFLAEARKRPELANLFTSFDPNYPQVKVELDREKARSLGVPINEVFQAMSAVLGGTLRQRLQPVRPPLPRLCPGRGRLPPEAVGHRGRVRPQPDHGPMIPLSTLVTITSVAGTEITTRFNLFRSVEINGVPAQGYSSGQALAALEDVFAKTMPKEMGFAYSSLSYQEKVGAARRGRPSSSPSCSCSSCSPRCTRAGGCRGRCCSARRWSRSAPSSACGSWATTTTSTCRSATSCSIGLAAKNAILIVEFAKAKQDEGSRSRRPRSSRRGCASGPS